VGSDVRGVHAKKGFNEGYALTQARIARICHHTDYDYDKRKSSCGIRPAASAY
jgi:hypothetical protein